MATKKKNRKTRHARINIPNWVIPFSVISVISAGLFYAAFAINNTSTIVTTLPDTYTITGSSIDLDLDEVIELPSSGWSDASDRISIEVSITNGSADNAIVDRSTDGCIIDISSSTSSSTFGTTQGNGAVNYDGDNTDNVFTFNDRTPQLTLLGLASEVKEAIGRVRASCNSQAVFAGKFIRVGAVPTIGFSSGSSSNNTNDCGDASVSCENLYYLFSTQQYYRVSNMTSGVSSGIQGIIDIWNKAKSMTIPVDGTNKTGGNRRGFVGTVATRDELLLTNAIRGTNIQMIGTTDLTGTFIYDTNWGGTGTNCATDEGTFAWLGPDRWCRLIPSWNRSGLNEWSPDQQTSSSSPNNHEESRYWSRDSSGIWSRGTSASFTIDLGNSTIPTTEDQSGTHNGYNFFHAWHTDGNGVIDEPNSSGDYIYLGYAGANNNPGWDDAYPGNGAGRDQINTTQISGRFIHEFCNPNQTCAPDANAVDSAQFKIAQTITFSGASSAYSTQTVNLTAASTTSGLTITYTTNDSNICTVSSSAVVTLVSRGTCTVTAAQSGNDDYLAATSVSQTFTSRFGPIFSGVITSCTGIGQLENGSFETITLGTQGTVGGGNTNPTGSWHGYANGPQQILFLDTDANLNQSVTPWDTTATNKIIEIQRAVAGSVDTTGQGDFDQTNFSPQEGIYMAELNATETSALYQDVATLPGSLLRWEIFHRGRKYTSTANDGDEMKVQIGATSASGYGSASAQSSIDQTPESGFDVDSSGTSGSISGTTIKTERSDGWYRVRGVYQVPTGQTTTRFAFSAISGLHSIGVGNLLDNITFTPNVACPFTKSIISGRTATINVFGDDVLTDSEESIAGTDSTIANTISVTSGSGSVTRANSNRSMQFTAPGSTGTSVVRFRVTNSFGDTADADATFNIVTDLTHVAPTVIPVDPRATFVDLPQVDVVGNSVSKAMVCFVQTDSSGNSLGTPNLNVQVRTAGNATLSSAAATTSEVSINGSIADVESASNSVRISNSTANTAVLNTNASKYIRVRTSGDDDVSSENCANGTGASRQQIIELRPVQLETTRRLGITVD